MAKIGLKAGLDDLRGILTPDAPIGAQSWFRCGGTAEHLYEPADEDDLQAFLNAYPTKAPLTIIGGLANTIVRDGGVKGVVLKLGKAFANIDAQTTQSSLVVGAGALNGSIASAAAKNGIGGLEFLSGIPGSLGGAVAMNAGAYGSEMADILQSVHMILRSGQRTDLTPQDLNMAYRHSEIPEGAVITGATLKGTAEATETVRTRLKDIKAKRNATQPIREDTGGSTFANPPGDKRAWEIVDAVGGRGLQIGGAQMSEMHCNFMLNTGTATAADLEALGDTLITRAQDQLGVNLRWEIKRIGDKKDI